MKDILLITPPFTQLNTPYPATAYLKGFLNTKNISSFQVDLGIEVILELFSREGLRDLFDYAFRNNTISSENSKKIFSLKDHYIKTIEEVVTYLQGKNQKIDRQVCAGSFLPKASRFAQLKDMGWTLEEMSIQDKAKYLLTLYLEDLSDFIIGCVDENFGFSRYAESLGRSANSFDELDEHLQQEKSYIDEITLEILDKRLKNTQTKLVCMSVPFPGNLYSAFRCAQFIKQNYPQIKLCMGGGFPTTELRSVSDPRVFNYFDYITLDDGELPIELILTEVLEETQQNLKRTFQCINGKVIYNNSSTRDDYKQADIGTPDYSGLLLDKYISLIEIANPMHSLWSDGRWNKLTMAHGCYWGKCTFCDVSLSYIKDYDPTDAKLLVDRIENIIAKNGEIACLPAGQGFHFVDEAAPPALMKNLAIEIIRRKLKITWWTNIRFEKSFTKDMCTLLKASGCIAVSGGLEVASDRLLKLINKGVTVEQVARVTRNLTDAGIMVHAYLMYGFPSQTVQETVDSLEMVRQMFELGIIQSGFWHQFALTAHSVVGLNPDKFEIVPELNEITFANNDIQFEDKTGINHGYFSFGLKKSLFNFMHGIGFEIPASDWFDFKVPKTKISKDFIEKSLITGEDFFIKPTAKIIWLGKKPLVSNIKKKRSEKMKMSFRDSLDSFEIVLDKEKGEWLVRILKKISIFEKDIYTFENLKKDFENQFPDFELFWYSKPINKLRKHGLLVL